MKRFVPIAVLLTVFCGTMLFAQQPAAEQDDVGQPDANAIGVDSAQQQLKEVSIDKFEIDGFWTGRISSDTGYITARLFEGGPIGKEPVPDEADMNIPDRYVLGARLDFLHWGYASFYLTPTRPLPVEGITKTISVWVVGRNFNHSLSILIEDFFGRRYELYMGKLNFQGWKKLTVAVPPQADDGRNGVVQRNYHYNSQMGIRIVGFRVDCDPMETEGVYYIYLDDLRAVTDLFAENNRDEDDMNDGW